MSRTSYRPPAALGLVAALLAYVGCSRPQGGAEPAAVAVAVADPGAPAPAPKGGAPAAPQAAPRASGKAPLADWPTPAAALVISGEQFGYLEPCGCTDGQTGGLIRRGNLVEQLAGSRKWPLALVDLGSLVKDPAAARGGPEQTRLKFHTALEALAVLKYNALALSPEDLKVGVDEAVGQFMNLPGETLKVVAANVSAAGIDRIVPSVRAKVGTVRLGVTAAVDPARLKALKDPSLDQLLAVKPIEAALPGVLADLEKDTDTQVLLVQGPPELARALAATFPGFDVVVATSEVSDPDPEPARLNGGKTLLVSVGHKGKFVGVVGIFDDPAGRYRYRRVALGSAFNGPAPAVKKVVEDEYRQALKEQGVVLNFPRHDFVNAAPGATFVGAESCRSCHPNTFAKWASTKHAKAFESLEHDPKPNTVFDAECVTCHTTGFEYTSGWKSPKLTAQLKGNQCENCHGPGSKHAAEPDSPPFRNAMHLTADLADKNRLCYRCHDEDNSPHFDFPKYYGQIAHKGLDDYRDPAAHRPAAKKVAAPAPPR